MSYYKYSRTVWKYVREEKENLSLPRALNPPWKPSALLNSGESGVVLWQPEYINIYQVPVQS